MGCKEDRIFSVNLCVRRNRVRHVDGFLTRHPIQEGEACSTEGHDERNRPDEEPTQHGEEGHQFKDDGTAHECIQRRKSAVTGEPRTQMSGDARRADG